MAPLLGPAISTTRRRWDGGLLFPSMSPDGTTCAAPPKAFSTSCEKSRVRTKEATCFFFYDETSETETETDALECGGALTAPPSHPNLWRGGRGNRFEAVTFVHAILGDAE